jgi:hypothetical protein
MPKNEPQPPRAIKNLVDLDTFDPARAISLRDAIQAGYFTIKGRRPCLQVVQRWANPNRGCAPVGENGPRLILPTLKVGVSKLTMPEWCEAFVRERQAMIIERAKKLMQ